MFNISAQIIKHRKSIVIIFAIAAIVSAIAQYFVSVNYNLTEYLPENAPSTHAINIMEEQFEGNLPNADVMIRDVSIQEALIYKKKIEQIDGVSDVTWLDDIIDLKVPLEMADAATIESYYKDGNALISLHVREGDEVPVTDAIYELIGENNAITGDAVTTASSQKMAGSESLYATVLLVPIIILILVLSTTSWIEPVFFLTAIGVSVLINLGTNIFLGEISFVTQAVSPILQLAVSIDYAIFLLHSFNDYRSQSKAPEEAMQLAIKQSFPTISASAVTTFFGFIALSFMNFEIGSDLGLNLVKGIVFSFIGVIVFLPALTLCFYRWIDRTQHKPIIPKFKNVGKFVMKLRLPVIILVLIVIVPSFLAQSSTSFTYGIGEQPETTRAGRDFKMVDETFGSFTPVVLLVPKESAVKELELSQALKKIDHITSVISYSNTVDSVIPPEALEPSITKSFYSDDYSRIIVQTDAGTEGDKAFALIDEIKELAASYYDDVLMLGESAALYDMKETVEKDNKLVNTITIVSIALALLVAFRSISFPVVLLLTIQAAVWINLAVPYFTDSPLVYVGYLIVSTVQLAATIDYAILLTEFYKEKRKEMPAMQAIKLALDEKTFSISISAAILSTVGFILWITSTNPIVSSIGLLLGRGALLAFIMVLVFLPAMLLVLDKIIHKTTWKAHFYKGE